MRRYPMALVLITALAVAGCSSSAKKAASDAAQKALASTTTSGSSSGGSSTTAGGSTGKVDCAKVKAAMPDFIVAVQHLASLKSADTYALVQDGTVQFDPDTFATAVDDMRSLESVNLAPLQSPGAVEDGPGQLRQGRRPGQDGPGQQRSLVHARSPTAGHPGG